MRVRRTKLISKHETTSDSFATIESGTVARLSHAALLRDDDESVTRIASRPAGPTRPLLDLEYRPPKTVVTLDDPSMDLATVSWTATTQVQAVVDARAPTMMKLGAKDKLAIATLLVAICFSLLSVSGGPVLRASLAPAESTTPFTLHAHASPQH